MPKPNEHCPVRGCPFRSQPCPDHARQYPRNFGETVRLMQRGPHVVVSVQRQHRRT